MCQKSKWRSAEIQTKILSLALLSIIFMSGCAPHIKPTDVCNFDIPVSQLHSNENFDYIDFFDFSIDIAKENGFQPPMKYDKDAGLIVFGSKKMHSMPGLKMIVYMWVDEASENVCMNYHILHVEGTALSDGIARENMLNFKNDLEEGYALRIENMERIFKKYQ